MSIDTIILVSCLLLFRYILYKVEVLWNLKGNPSWLWGLIFCSVIIVGMLPIIFLKEGILENSSFNIVVAGFGVFYFAFLIGKMSKKSPRNGC